MSPTGSALRNRVRRLEQQLSSPASTAESMDRAQQRRDSMTALDEAIDAVRDVDDWLDALTEPDAPDGTSSPLPARFQRARRRFARQHLQQLASLATPDAREYLAAVAAASGHYTPRHSLEQQQGWQAA